MAGSSRKAGAGYTEPDTGGWIEHRGDTYRYHVYLVGEAGQFKAVAATVPDVIANGATEDEALDSVLAQLANLLRAKKAAGDQMPRTEITPPPGAQSRVVIVRLGE